METGIPIATVLRRQSFSAYAGKLEKHSREQVKGFWRIRRIHGGTVSNLPIDISGALKILRRCKFGRINGVSILLVLIARELLCVANYMAQ